MKSGGYGSQVMNKLKPEPERQAFTLSDAPADDIDNLRVGFQRILDEAGALGATEIDEAMPSADDSDREKAAQ
ncbi:hypothetical protein [Pseudorhizobium flavum]|uniref:hypothetical protein n=1 Tax=Pseudorhizobium flavum TaxID=1335061 RepID=UPI0037703B61